MSGVIEFLKQVAALSFFAIVTMFLLRFLVVTVFEWLEQLTEWFKEMKRRFLNK